MLQNNEDKFNLVVFYLIPNAMITTKLNLYHCYTLINSDLQQPPCVVGNYLINTSLFRPLLENFIGGQT